LGEMIFEKVKRKGPSQQSDDSARHKERGGGSKRGRAGKLNRKKKGPRWDAKEDRNGKGRGRQGRRATENRPANSTKSEKNLGTLRGGRNASNAAQKRARSEPKGRKTAKKVFEKKANQQQGSAICFDH